MKKTFTLLSMLMICLLTFAQNPCPQVIPALQEWKGAKGTLLLPTQGNIVIHPSDAESLTSTASILANDLKDMLGWNYIITTGKPKKNDIYLSLTQPDEQLGKEGYVLTINQKVNIEAPTPQGVFWGTRSLLQMLFNQMGMLFLAKLLMVIFNHKKEQMCLIHPLSFANAPIGFG